MAIPVAPNTTCDVYHAASGPPGTPDVVGVRFHLKEDATSGAEHTEGGLAQTWTHIGLFDLAADIRDGGPWTTGDNLYVPDKNGTKFTVLLVVRAARGTAQEHRRAYLQRQGIGTWPTTEL